MVKVVQRGADEILHQKADSGALAFFHWKTTAFLREHRSDIRPLDGTNFIFAQTSRRKTHLGPEQSSTWDPCTHADPSLSCISVLHIHDDV